MKSDNEQQDSEKSRENQKKKKRRINHTAEIKNTEYFCEICFFHNRNRKRH